jgi:SAM-dependent methyltransferase
MTTEKTDWDAYYKRPMPTAAMTRKITTRKLLRSLREQLGKREVSVCELGGANSCFIDDFLSLPSVVRYHVIDLNEYGVDLLRQRFDDDARVTAELADATAITHGAGTHDVVYSVGLIEHFDSTTTARCIVSHFNLCRPGGTVLITFPTPTLPYRLIRGAAESVGIWAFPDERPLQFREVMQTCSEHGKIVHHSTNWWIGLTQGYVVTTAGRGGGL